jgi:hypothetical protein
VLIHPLEDLGAYKGVVGGGDLERGTCTMARPLEEPTVNNPGRNRFVEMR